MNFLGFSNNLHRVLVRKKNTLMHPKPFLGYPCLTPITYSSPTYNYTKTVLRSWYLVFNMYFNTNSYSTHNILTFFAWSAYTGGTILCIHTPVYSIFVTLGLVVRGGVFFWVLTHEHVAFGEKKMMNCSRCGSTIEITFLCRLTYLFVYTWKLMYQIVNSW